MTANYNPERSPSIIVVGTPAATDRVEASLRSLHANVTASRDVSACAPLVGSNQSCVILAGFGVRQSLRDCTARLASHARTFGVPAVVLVGEGYEPERARALYRAGAVGVFTWPTEGLLLSRVLENLASSIKHHGYPDSADAAVGCSVQARLASLAPELDPHIRVKDFHVTITGVVGSLAERYDLANHLAMVPGVRSVDTEGLLLDTDVKSDATLARRARAALHDADRTETKTVGVSVRRGRAVLAGTVEDHDELAFVERLVAGVEGVRGIDNLLAVSRSQRVEDEARADKAQHIVDGILEDHEGVWVTICGPVAILSGRSQDEIPIGQLEARLGADLGVRRVVDSIDIRA